MITNTGLKLFIKNYFECKAGDSITFEINNSEGKIDCLKNDLFRGSVYNTIKYFDSWKTDIVSKTGFTCSDDAFDWIKDQSKKFGFEIEI